MHRNKSVLVCESTACKASYSSYLDLRSSSSSALSALTLTMLLDKNSVAGTTEANKLHILLLKPFNCGRKEPDERILLQNRALISQNIYESTFDLIDAKHRWFEFAFDDVADIKLRKCFTKIGIGFAAIVGLDGSIYSWLVALNAILSTVKILRLSDGYQMVIDGNSAAKSRTSISRKTISKYPPTPNMTD
uniref:Uncharacterized protein n=1 Tax=Glossina brevipalpis TaxID=37001 RepID=A0A1A9WBJ7_9MUSC